MRYWVHNGFVNVDAEKMSKSLGNFFTIREATAVYAPVALRFWLLVRLCFRKFYMPQPWFLLIKRPWSWSHSPSGSQRRCLSRSTALLAAGAADDQVHQADTLV